MSGGDEFWAATIKAYAPLQLTSPELTPKLLQRPPFRFIFDIVCGINARFAAYDHVIPAAFKDAQMIDTKEKKIEYLQVLIDYVGKLLNITVDVNPKKIVTGNEAEKTNIFLQYLATAVGYAQQDKEKTAAAAAPSPPAVSGATPSPPVASPPPTKSSATAGKETGKPGSLPDRSTLPKRRPSFDSSTAQKAANARAIDEATAFTKKLKGFSIDLKTSESSDVQKDGQNIVKMWQELQHPAVETKPATMPQEALELAIKRQIDAVKQVQALQRENDTIIDHLETLLTE